jgi:hypothetical protein
MDLGVIPVTSWQDSLFVTCLDLLACLPGLPDRQTGSTCQTSLRSQRRFSLPARLCVITHSPATLLDAASADRCLVCGSSGPIAFCPTHLHRLQMPSQLARLRIRTWRRTSGDRVVRSKHCSSSVAGNPVNDGRSPHMYLYVAIGSSAGAVSETSASSSALVRHIPP